MRLSPSSVAKGRRHNTARSPIAIEATRYLQREMKAMGHSGVAQVDTTHQTIAVQWTTWDRDALDYILQYREMELPPAAGDWLARWDNLQYTPKAHGFPSFPELSAFLDETAAQFAAGQHFKADRPRLSWPTVYPL